MATVRIENPGPDQAFYSLKVATEGALDKILEAFEAAGRTGRTDFVASYTERDLRVTIHLEDNRPKPQVNKEGDNEP